jgi:hypothetical protein
VVSDGSIKVWGLLTHGGKGAPVDDGYTRIYSTSYAFVAAYSRHKLAVDSPAWFCLRILTICVSVYLDFFM